jgi:hypothetical protein
VPTYFAAIWNPNLIPSRGGVFCSAKQLFLSTKSRRFQDAKDLICYLFSKTKSANNENKWALKTLKNIGKWTLNENQGKQTSLPANVPRQRCMCAKPRDVAWLWGQEQPCRKS